MWFVWGFSEKGSDYVSNLGCPETQYVDKASLELKDICLPLPRVLVLKTFATNAKPYGHLNILMQKGELTWGKEAKNVGNLILKLSPPPVFPSRSHTVSQSLR